MENDVIFENMVKGLGEDDKKWLRSRFVDNLSLTDAEKRYNISNGATHEQQILRKLRREPITEQF